MRKTREQRLTELLQASTTNTTATSMVHATITNATKAGWAWFWFGIIGWLIVGADQSETGFAMIDEGKIYFYRVSGLGKRQTIDGRREILFNRLEKVRRVRGGGKTPAALNIRWRNNNNKLLDLTLGGMNVRHFPSQLSNIDEMTELISANNVEIKRGLSLRNIAVIALWIIAALVFVIFMLAVLASL